MSKGAIGALFYVGFRGQTPNNKYKINLPLELNMSDGNTMRERALRYHSKPTPGKIALSLTTATENADDLALAYSPGVGEPVK